MNENIVDQFSSIEPMDENIVEEFFQILSSKNYANRKEYECTAKELFDKYKIRPSKTTMIHYYRNLINQNKIKSNPELEVYMRPRGPSPRSSAVVVTTVKSSGFNGCPLDCYHYVYNRSKNKIAPIK